MSLEPFLYLLLFLLFALLSFVARWLKREFEGSADREAESKVYGLFQEGPKPIAYTEKKFTAPEKKVKDEPVMPLFRPRKIHKKTRIQPGNLQEMRRGIVLMTILGPCRAFEPPNQSGHV